MHSDERHISRPQRRQNRANDGWLAPQCLQRCGPALPPARRRFDSIVTTTNITTASTSTMNNGGSENISSRAKARLLALMMAFAYGGAIIVPNDGYNVLEL